jgi:hypothetical protein
VGVRKFRPILQDRMEKISEIVVVERIAATDINLMADGLYNKLEKQVFLSSSLY